MVLREREILYANSVIMKVLFRTRKDLTDPNVEELFEIAEMLVANQQPGGEYRIVDGFPKTRQAANTTAVVDTQGRENF